MLILRCLLVILNCDWVTSLSSYYQLPKRLRYNNIYEQGDVIFGGLFTVHLQNTTKQDASGYTCDGPFNRRGYIVTEAMIFAINQINRDNTLLPGIRIGYDIKDTCGEVGSAIRVSLNYSFVKKHFQTSSECIDDEKKKRRAIYDNPETVVIIGPDSSDLARSIADFAGLFNIPVISPSATSLLLSDQKRFKYFLRTVPSDTYQVHVLLQILQHFNWSYIILLSSDNEYGRSAHTEFRNVIHSTGICAEIDEIVRDENSLKIIEDIKKAKSKIIVFISSLYEAIQFIQLSVDHALNGYTWIASDGWNNNPMAINGKENILKGMLGVSPLRTEVDGFIEYLYNKTFGKVEEMHQWTIEFAMNEHATTCANKSLSDCMLSSQYQIPYKISSTVNAVYAVSHALHAFLQCDSQKCQRKLTNINWSSFFSYVKNVSFIDSQGHPFYFDENGSGRARYNLWNFQEILHQDLTKSYQFDVVGSWNGKHLVKDGVKQFEVNTKSIYWNTADSKVPASNCSNKCPPGQYRRPKDSNPQCCWTCIDCDTRTFSNESNVLECQTCGKNFWPNSDKTACQKIEDIYLDYYSYWSVAILTISFVGLILIVFTFGVFMYYWSTPVIRASSRGMCYVIMIGISTLYLLPLTVIGTPTNLRCKMVPFMLGLSMSLNIGTLLVKTNRIARIFSRKLFEKKKMRFLSLKYHYLMILCLVGIEVLICSIWEFFLTKPYLAYSDQIVDAKRIIYCSYGGNFVGLVMWSMYNAGLIIICTYQAFLVRKVPTNYNEAKFIAFTMLTICTVVFVYIPVYLGTIGFSRDVVACVLYIFAALVEYSCIFLPKLYIVLIRPDKNVPMRQPVSPTNSRKVSCAFESEGDYLPTEKELNALKMIRKNSQKYSFTQYLSPKTKQKIIDTANTQSMRSKHPIKFCKSFDLSSSVFSSTTSVPSADELATKKMFQSELNSKTTKILKCSDA